MPQEEQKALAAKVIDPFNRPVAGGSHLLKTWEYLHDTGDDLSYKQQEAIDHIRAWKGRLQIYTCVFEQDIWALFEQVQCPVLALCARDDILWPYFHYVNDIVSLAVLW